jgi:hypothetical protein
MITIASIVVAAATTAATIDVEAIECRVTTGAPPNHSISSAVTFTPNAADRTTPVSAIPEAASVVADEY